MDSGFVAHHRRLVKGLAVLIVLLAIFAGVGQAFAQGPQPVRADAGGPPEPYARRCAPTAKACTP